MLLYGKALYRRKVQIDCLHFFDHGNLAIIYRLLIRITRNVHCFVNREAELINLEALAYWYFRLNGSLTTANFVIHDEGGAGQRTDADILAGVGQFWTSITPSKWFIFACRLTI